MHRRARRGEYVELAPRRITVHELELRSLDLPFMEFRVRCSSGTYVRSLARDIGEALGVGAHLTALRRTSIGAHTLEAAIAPAQLGDAEAVSGALVVDEESRDRLACGQTVDAPDAAEAEHITVACDGRLVAIAEVRAGTLIPKKVFLP
jgi:tRNA pseudouridine55 synthase